jgi:hypothetical protein
MGAGYSVKVIFSPVETAVGWCSDNFWLASTIRPQPSECRIAFGSRTQDRGGKLPPKANTVRSER